MDLLTAIANEFCIPIIEENQKIWFFRTKGGLYFYDFWINNYIALGWDLISPEFIQDAKSSDSLKKEQIVRIYPKEMRPGLILGQMETFYKKMQPGDIVIIPSKGTRQIAIGKIGNLQDTVKHEIRFEEYAQCNFVHKRGVVWIKIVESWQDIYLFKALQGQQTISDITESARLVLRNLFPVYVSGESIHLMLQKKTDSEWSLVNNVDLLSGVLEIADQTSELYGVKSFRQEIAIKTAAGSQGFIEMILPKIPVSEISIVLLSRVLIGKIKGADGSAVSGITAIITKINDLVNDVHNRKRIDAETRKMDAETRLTNAQVTKTLAEAELIKAQVRKTEAEAYGIELQNKKAEMGVQGKPAAKPEHEKLICADEETILFKARIIAANGEKIRAAAARSDMSFDRKSAENGICNMEWKADER